MALVLFNESDSAEGEGKRGDTSFVGTYLVCISKHTHFRLSCVIISVDICGVQSILVGGLDSLQWGKESVHTGKLLLASPRSRVWLASMRV